MRNRVLAPAAIAAAAVAFAAPAAAASKLTHQINVTVTNTGCSLQLESVSHRNTTIVFHVIDNSTRPAGIVVYGLKSKFAAPHVGAADLTITFRGAGHYPLRCVAGPYGHPLTLKRVSFTIRRN